MSYIIEGFDRFFECGLFEGSLEEFVIFWNVVGREINGESDGEVREFNVFIESIDLVF